MRLLDLIKCDSPPPPFSNENVPLLGSSLFSLPSPSLRLTLIPESLATSCASIACVGEPCGIAGTLTLAPHLAVGSVIARKYFFLIQRLYFVCACLYVEVGWDWRWLISENMNREEAGGRERNGESRKEGKREEKVSDLGFRTSFKLEPCDLKFL